MHWASTAAIVVPQITPVFAVPVLNPADASRIAAVGLEQARAYDAAYACFQAFPGATATATIAQFPGYSPLRKPLPVTCSMEIEPNLVGLWSAGDNQFYAGQWTIAVEVEAGPLLEESSTFEPASQTTHLKRGECFADKLFFLPFVPIDVGGDRAVSRTALYLLRLSNGGRNSATFRVRVRLVFPAQPSDLFTRKPPAEQAAKLVVLSGGHYLHLDARAEMTEKILEHLGD